MLSGDAALRDIGNIALEVGVRACLWTKSILMLHFHSHREPLSSRSAICRHQQPDQGVWTERAALRMGVWPSPNSRDASGFLKDLMDASQVHAAERMSAIALDHLQQFARRAQELLETNRPLLDQFLDAQKNNLEFCATVRHDRFSAANARERR